MKLWEVSNIRSLFSVRIAATIMLEKLEISYCEELKHIIANEGEDYDHIKKSSIFPKLQVLYISNCLRLQFIFPSTFSGGLQELKHLTVIGAFELKYVFGKYNHEDHLSNDDENDEFLIDLAVLQTLSLEDVPNMINICINKYHLRCPSLQNMDAAKTTEMHMQNVTSEGTKISEIEEIINVERPGYKYALNFHNLQQITIARSQRLETMFSASTWRRLPNLSKLCIRECDELRNLVEDDSSDHGRHIEYKYIFRNLEVLEIRRCMNLEFIFPSHLSGGLPKLTHLVVGEAPKLKCIFGKYYGEGHLTNEIEIDEVQVDLFALETLSLTEVPNMINIYASKHNILRFPSLLNIALDNCQQLSTRVFPDMTFYWKPEAAKDIKRVIMHQTKLTSLAVERSIIEEVFNFGEDVEVKGTVTLNLNFMRLKYLWDLCYICRGRKYILSLRYLSQLEIESCPKLRVVLSASMSKSLPLLSHLRIEDCPELVHLIEDDDDDEDHLQQLCFPKLEFIDIEHCDSLRCLFSISTFGMLPSLRRLQIVDSSEIEQVFTCKQDDIQKMAVKDVIPLLSILILVGLPRLVTVCGSINFQTLQYVEVFDCPRFQGPQDWDSSENAAATKELPSALKMPYMGETSSSPNFAESSKRAMGITDDEEAPIPLISSVVRSPSPSIHELEDEETTGEPTVQLQHQDRGNEMKWLEHSVIVSIEGDIEAEKEVGKGMPALELTSPKSSKRAKWIIDDEEAHIPLISSVLEDEETMSEPTVQVQHQDRASGFDFIHFESRESTFKELVEALENEDYYIIGLLGLGGIGKTTLAAQVGFHVKESKAFQEVIFATVSNSPEISKIQDDIAVQLGLSSEEREEAEHSEVLKSRIANQKGRLLIILDDVWTALNLEDIGIPSGNDQKNCCVLVTARNFEVCRAMGCQLTIHLLALTEMESLNLFMKHANDNALSSSALNGVALDIVKGCEGLPLAIVEMARTLRNRPVGEWKLALPTSRNSQPSVDVDEGLTNIHKWYKSRYDNLRSEKAKKLFLLCSLFPEDYEIPISFLISVGIGAGIFGEVDKYCEARCQALLAVKNELGDSYLLLIENGCVHMDDVGREVAWKITEEDTQVIMNSNVPLISNLRFLFWCADDLPNQFHGTKLEVLLLWIKRYVKLEDAKAIFKEMGGLRVMVLRCDVENRLTLPLQSFLLLKNIRTLVLDGWKLENISILENIRSLEALELNDCSITELPKEIEELKKLKLLGLKRCSIDRYNPFEVIERCSQLEELYFDGNFNAEDWKTKCNGENIDRVSQDISPPVLQMYYIACSGLEYFDGENDLLKCFSTKHVKNLISGALFQYLLEKGEVLELEGKEETRWRSLVPDIIPFKNGVMNDLIKLYLYEWDGIEYLIDAAELLLSYVTVFSKLVELHMRDVGVKELCRGPMPSGFLNQLQVLKLWRCMKLQNVFPDGCLKLPHLKAFKLKHCSMVGPSIFKPFVAASLVRLEELVIEDCDELRSLISYESLGEEMVGVDHQNSYGLLFPRLKTLIINGCETLEVVWPLLLAGDLPLLQDLSIRYCGQLKYIFDEYRDEDQSSHEHTMLPSLSTIDLYWVPSLINILRECKKCMQRPPPIVKHDSKQKQVSVWVRWCCFSYPTTDTNLAVSKAKIQQHTISLESSGKRIEVLFTAECLLRPPLGFRNIRNMKLWEVSNIRSLFSVSIAATIMLEKLEISYCEELKHIIANEGEDCDHMKKSSIFPKLQVLHISNCLKLQFIFPYIFSGGLQELKHLTVIGAFELKYVFGKYNHEDHLSNDNEHDEFNIDLPALEELSLEDVPNMIGICINKCHLKCPSLQNQEAAKTTRMHMPTVTSEVALESEIEEIINVERPRSKYGLNVHNLQQITIARSRRLKTLFSTSTWGSLPQLSKLHIWECDELRNVVDDDSKDHVHVNYSSIFPKLEDLQIRRCVNLEFLFPPPVPGGLPKLKYLVVGEAPKVKYIFGKYSTNENESDDDVQVDLSALETLSFTEVPNMINIYATKHNILRFPSLLNIALDNCQQLSARVFPDMTFYWKPAAVKDITRVIMHQKKLTSLAIERSIIEEVFNFGEDVEVKGTVTLNLNFMRLKYLWDLCYICRGRKYILSLRYLSKIEIESCPRLRVVLSASMSKSLPLLSHLRIQDCPELVHLIEEDDDNEDHLQQLCFPKLEFIDIEHCDSLKCLFSISTFGMLPSLRRLQIVDSSEIEQVFTFKQDDIQKMAVKDVIPLLSILILVGLPRLVSVCGSINFRTLQYVEMFDCPSFQGPQDWDSSEKAAATKEPPSAQKMSYMGETSSSPNFAESSKRAMGISDDDEASIQLISSVELEDKETLSEPTVQLQHQHWGHEIKSLEQSVIEIIEGDKETEKEVGKVVPALEFATSPKVSSMKEIVQLGFQEHDRSKEAIITRKQSGVPLVKPPVEFAQSLEAERDRAVGMDDIASQTSVPASSFNAKKRKKRRRLFRKTANQDAAVGIQDTPTKQNPDSAATTAGRVPVPTEKAVAKAAAQAVAEASKRLSNQTKENHAATVIQTASRGNLQGWSFYQIETEKAVGKAEAKAKAAIVAAQAEVEAAKRHSNQTKENHAATVIQTAFRGYLVNQRKKETMKQGLQENYALEEAKSAIESASSDLTKQFKEPFLKLPEKGFSQSTKEVSRKTVKEVTATETPPMSTPFESEFKRSSTTKETRDASVKERPMSDEPARLNLSDDIISSPHSQSPIGGASTSSSMLEIGEILELVEVKDDERALLVKALELYPQLRLSRRCRPIIAFAYRVLIDILIILSTKTPYTITEVDKSTLEKNLGAATFFGFDKDWVEFVRAKVFGIDMVTREKMPVP